MRVFSTVYLGMLSGLFFIVSCKASAPSSPASSVSTVTKQAAGNTTAGSSLALANQPIVAANISAINSGLTQPPTQAELIAALKRSPISYTQQAALSLAEYSSLPLKTQQIVAILINRGILHWENSKLLDYNQLPTSLAMLDDYISRLDLFLAAYLPSLGLTSSIPSDSPHTASATATSSSTSASVVTSIFTVNNLTIVVGLATAVATLIWGYREWTGNTAAIKAAAAQAQLEAKVQALETTVKKLTPPNDGTKGEPAPEKEQASPANDSAKASNPPITDASEKPAPADGGRFYDPSTANHGRYIFSPLLVATGLAALGISIDQIVETVKSE